MKFVKLIIALGLATMLAFTGFSGASTQSAAVAAAGPSKAALKGSVKLDKKARLTFLPANYGGTYIAVATFGTGYKNRAVSLQSKSGGKWKHVAASKMDAKGKATFTLKKVSNISYRAVADTHKIKKKTYAPVKTTAVKGNSQWERVIRDDFSGTALTSRWGTGQEGIFAGSRLCSAADASATKVSNGKLVASVRKLDSKKPAEKDTITSVTAAARTAQQERKDAALSAAGTLTGSTKKAALEKANAMTVKGCPDGVFYNARIDTQKTFHMSEGMLAARVKFPKDQGMHGSVWLQTMRNNSIDRPAGTEIDLIEAFGYGKGVTNIIHVDEKGKGQLKQFGGYVLKDKVTDPTWWDKYHVYSVEWTHSEFVFRIDGVETQRIRKKAVKDDEYFLVISLLTSDWETPLLTKPKTSKKTPGVKKANLSKATMYVDWIEGWERT